MKSNICIFVTRFRELLLGIVLTSFITISILVSLSQHASGQSVTSSLSHSQIDEKVKSLLSEMSLEDKIGQMTQVTIDVISVTGQQGVVEPHQIDLDKLRTAIQEKHVGSILNVANHAYTREHWLEIMQAIEQVTTEQKKQSIPVLYGIDAIHGASYTIGSTMFPQEIAMAATFNRALVEQAGSITAYETRASYIPWTFSPALDLGRNPVWPRMWESFGEDVYLTSEMAKAIISGYQGTNLADKYKIASCLKHYLGYGATLSGKDRTPAWIPEIYIREYFLPPFANAIKAGAKTIMINSGEINGTPVHADHHILTEILRWELGFDGIAVSDWEDIKRLHDVHKVAATDKEAVKMAVMAGVDMSMVPNDYSFYDLLLQLVKDGEVPLARIDEAVKRILKVKFELGLFDKMYYPATDYPKFGSDEFTRANYNTAAEAITLLKNQDNVLPIRKDSKVLVTGFAANSMRCLNGGWSYTWQGQLTDSYAENKQTIFEAISEVAGKDNIMYAEGTQFDKPSEDASKALKMAKKADYIVLCVGELSYCEVFGNINDLYLPAAQVEFANQLAATGKPVILVLAEGRPRIISKFADDMKGIIMAYLPGNEGGRAIADVLYGNINPSGKLPFTYPRFANDLVHYDRKVNEGGDQVTNPFTVYNPQFDFGFGLSYTTFAYSNLTVSARNVNKADKFEVTVDVTNTGKIAGKEAVQLYVSDDFASITPSVKRLRDFEKIELQPGETKKVKFELAVSELAFVNREYQWVTEPGSYTLAVGGLKQKIELQH